MNDEINNILFIENPKIESQDNSITGLLRKQAIKNQNELLN
jgi:hypothetical protein